MSVSDNSVFKAAAQLAGNSINGTPEGIIWGFAKLLCMDEGMLQILVGEEGQKDLEAAHKWFEKNKISLDTVRNRMRSFFYCIIDDDERKTNIDSFEAFIGSDSEDADAEGILDKMVGLSSLNILELFSEDSDPDELEKQYDDLMDRANKFNESNKSDDNKDSEPDKKSSNKKDSDTQIPAFMRADRSADKKHKTDKKQKKLKLSELSDNIKNLNASLADVVKGQDSAVIKFIKGYAQGELLRLSENKKAPRSYFFFFGPPGVGKTLLANTAADALGLPFKVFNMSEYAGHQAHEELLGVASFYKDSKEGTLVKYVRENPECVLLFDEIEKAHINVIRQFLQILGSGTLDNKNIEKQISFKDTIIIFTSNVGRKLFSDRSEKFSTLPDKVLTDIIASEKNEKGEPVLPIEICSRIASGTSVMFDHLSVRQLADLVRKNFDAVAEGMKSEYGVKVTYSSYLPLLFLFSYGAEIDARVATSQSANFLKNEIYELLRQMENSNNSRDEITSVKLDVDWKGMAPDLKRLFVNKDKAEVLLFADKDSDVFDSIDKKKYVVHKTDDIDEAKEFLKNDLLAIFIDPTIGGDSDNDTILSITDYNTAGVKLFHDIIATQASIPIYMLEVDRALSDVDRDTFFQEGAAGVLKASENYRASLKRQFNQIMDELYMENENRKFTQRGYVIGYGTKQIIDENGKATILFYDLKRATAVDSETRGSMLLDNEKPDVRFSDVIGAGAAKEELDRFVSYLKNPKKYLASGGKPSKGVLLYGPPGTGKTMLAKAMAGEADVSFFEKSATDLLESGLGQNEDSIKWLFKKARKYAPSIIFIDEIDAIGKKRTGSAGSSYTEQLLNALLTQMDGFSSGDVTKPVFVLAATNYGVREGDDNISELDAALVRRFSARVKVDLPNEGERKEFIKRFIKKRGITTLSEQAINNVAARTAGNSIAILQNVFDNAFDAAYKLGRGMNDGDILTALEDYVHGEKKERTPEYYRRVAYHETGHAYVSYMNGNKPAYITIESRGDFGGYVAPERNENRTGYTKDELLGIIRSSLAGRCAEQEFYPADVAMNTGASSDLEHATNIAFEIICRLGMGDSLLVLSRQEVMVSSLASEYVARVNALLNEQMEITKSMIRDGRDVIEKIVEELVRDNRITGERFAELMEEFTKKDE